MGKSMQHWNGRQLCAIDTETTGLDPFWHEIVQICILPLDSNILPRKDVAPFYINLIPENPERLEKEAFKKNKLKIDDLVNKGFDRIAAIDMLGDWIAKLGLPVTAYGTPKTIIPLGHNYGFDRVFMIKWLGNDLYDTYFHYHFRDTMIAANYINDAAATHAEDVPFSKVGLQWLCNKLDVQSEKAHDALSDCLSTANVYRSLLKKGLVC
jgi:DNA polymerase III epsilon subunit-like protein